MKLSTLKGGEETTWIKVPGEDEKVRVVYRPGALTLEIADRVREAALGGLDAEIAKEMLVPLLVEWDITDDDGKQLGVTEEEIKKVPIGFLGLILAQVGEESSPNALRDATSNGSSLQAVEQEASQSGTSSSEQQTDSTLLPLSS